MFKSVKKLFGKPPRERASLLLMNYLENLKGALAGRAVADLVAENVKRDGEDAALAGFGADSEFEFSQSFSIFAGGIAPAFVGAVLPETSEEEKLSAAGTPLTAVFGIGPHEAVDMIVQAVDVLPDIDGDAAMPASEEAFLALSEEEQFSWQVYAAVQYAVGQLVDAFAAGKSDYTLTEEEVDNLSNVLWAAVVA